MKFEISAFIEKHKLEIDRLRKQLATNFDVPAQRLIKVAFTKMGEDRFVGGDDRWEQIQAHLVGREYEKPAPELIRRWARY